MKSSIDELKQQRLFIVAFAVDLVATGATVFEVDVFFFGDSAPFPHRRSTRANLSGVSFAYQNLLALCHLKPFSFNSVLIASSGISSKEIYLYFY